MTLLYVVKAFGVLIFTVGSEGGAPSSSPGRCCHRRGQGSVELAGDVALEAAPDLLGGLAFGAAAGDVGAGGRAAAHPGGGDGVDCAVECPVAALAEPVAHGPAAAGRQRAGAGQRGECGLVAAPAGVGVAHDGLALPAGGLGDIVDRRRLLIGLQGFQLVVGAVLVALTVAGRLSPAPLLVLTFLLGCGQALTVPGYQALVQDLVPRTQLRSAAALNGVAMNL